MELGWEDARGLGLVALEKHCRSSHAGGRGGPSEKRRSILRSRTTPGFT